MSRVLSALCVLVLASSVRAGSATFRVDASVPAEVSVAVRQVAEEMWQELARRLPRLTPGSDFVVVIRSGKQLHAGHAGRSRPGTMEVRVSSSLDAMSRMALRHEVAHQFLWSTCAFAVDDPLLHEAFAMSVSGELESWIADDVYRSDAKAVSILRRDPGARTTEGRRALARLLEHVGPDGFHPVVRARLESCGSGGRLHKLTPEELVPATPQPDDDVWVVLSRHSGEVLESRGAIDEPLSPGSTLKPLLVASRPSRLPEVVVQARDGQPWSCGAATGTRLGWQRALQLSCNEYFLETVSASTNDAMFGAWTPLLRAAGMEGEPRHAQDAIGLTHAVRIPPLGLARAYRVLAEVAPDVIEALRSVPIDGTLAGLPESSWAVTTGLALKTGTVRDLEMRPALGWLVAISEDLVVVQVAPGRAPRQALDELRRRWPGPGVLAAAQAARVQAFGLMPLASVEVRCARGAGLRVVGERFSLLSTSFASLATLARERARLMCLSAPLLVRFPGLDGPRVYAGVMEGEPLPPSSPAQTRAERARRGSNVVFRTTRLRYAQGVLASEDAQARGGVRDALLMVVDFNQAHSRHDGRPVCDTTHCQVFQGTPSRRDDALEAAALHALSAKLRSKRDWLHFAKGGDEPWERALSVDDVAKRLGTPVGSMQREGDVVLLTRTSAAPDGTWFEEPARWSCESLRGALMLPSCPEKVSRKGSEFVFSGRGEGHGLGIDVERAKRHPEDTTPSVILEEAYGQDVWLEGSPSR
ncbi:MAG: hypothetical protein AB2A00_10890 [Myxococcota bacterium]